MFSICKFTFQRITHVKSLQLIEMNVDFACSLDRCR
jgi:hypothetical protein